jgi:DNA-binding MarR family transcriptional regulator
MEEKRNYVVFSSIDYDETERIVSMTKAQADAIRWFMDNFNINGCVELAENYEGEEI